MAEKGVSGARLSKLGRYEVLSELGKGAMGVVYLAKDPVIGRMVAIKTIRASSIGDDDAESREFRERFIREAQTAGILSHPNIVTIHDIGEDPETQTSFIAMEYIEGKNLKTLLSERANFSYDQIADVIAQVAEAIDYAHRKGIIHRDIKPANIIITTDEKVKITDFGIAKVASSNLTTTGQFLGTPNYMSPEQVSGAPVDGRSDIFSLGVVLYELLTGRKPFQGDNLTAISYKIVHEDFTPPAELSSEVPPEFNPIVARAMAKDPWNRYQRGKDFALALHQLRAHLEEQRALQDLGTMVSEAEFMPTLRLANLEELAAQGAPGHAAERRSTEVFPPPEPERSEPLRATATYPNKAFPGSEISVAQAEPSPATGPAATVPLTSVAPEEMRTKVIPREEMQAALSAARPLPSRVSTVTPPPARLPATPPSPPVTPRAAPVPADSARARAAKSMSDTLDAFKRRTSGLAARDWSKLLKAEVNPRWFWGVAGAVAVFWLLLLLPIFVHSRLVARPSVPFDVALKRETDDRRTSLEQAKRLFTAGQYEQTLSLCRSVLSRSPNNQIARRYAQMAEAALTGRAQEAQKSAQAQDTLDAGQKAFAQGNYEEAQRRADEALALDGGRVEAQKLRDDAGAKVADARSARKKPVRPTAAPVRRASVPTAAPAVANPMPAPTAPVVAGPTTLRLLFDSPVSEGNVMVAVNDQILLRKQFDFRKKEGFFKRVSATGTVDVSLPVKAGSIAVKAWLSGPDIPASILAQTSGQIGSGETRILRLEFASGHLSARIQ
jgi:tRNA A-37 threonylcarbamoyl transferase component Bud32/tetratricopeptide (TPR) repeat protein